MNKLLLVSVIGLLGTIGVNAMDNAHQNGGSSNSSNHPFYEAVSQGNSHRALFFLTKDDSALPKSDPFARQLSYVVLNQRHDPRKIDLSAYKGDHSSVVGLNRVIMDFAVGGKNSKFIDNYDKLLKEHPNRIHPAIRAEFTKWNATGLEDLRAKQQNAEPRMWQDDQSDDEI